MKFDSGIFHAGEVFSVSPLAPQPSVWASSGGYHSVYQIGLETILLEFLMIG